MNTARISSSLAAKAHAPGLLYTAAAHSCVLLTCSPARYFILSSHLSYARLFTSLFYSLALSFILPFCSRTRRLFTSSLFNDFALYYAFLFLYVQTLPLPVYSPCSLLCLFVLVRAPVYFSVQPLYPLCRPFVLIRLNALSFVTPLYSYTCVAFSSVFTVTFTRLPLYSPTSLFSIPLFHSRMSISLSYPPLLRPPFPQSLLYYRTYTHSHWWIIRCRPGL